MKKEIIVCIIILIFIIIGDIITQKYSKNSADEITKELQKKDPTLIKDALKIAGKAYSGEDGMDNFLVNPILGPIKGLKNIVIFTGTHDILNPDTRKFYKRAQKENVEIDYREVENAIHIWMTYRGKKKEYKSDETFKEIIDLLKKDSENKV